MVVLVTETLSGLGFAQKPMEMITQESLHGSGFAGDYGDCRSCVSEILALMDGVASKRLEGMLHFLDRTFQPNGSEYHVFLEGEDRETKTIEDYWKNRHSHSYVHTFPCGTFGSEGVAELIARRTGVRQPQTAYFRDPGFSGSIDEFLQAHNGSPVPFVWTKRTEVQNSNRAMCKVMLETLRTMAAFIMNREWTSAGNIHGPEEELMNWKQKLESWFAAVAFAGKRAQKTRQKKSDT
jgi:hypothetical protein